MATEKKKSIEVRYFRVPLSHQLSRESDEELLFLRNEYEKSLLEVEHCPCRGKAGGPCSSVCPWPSKGDAEHPLQAITWLPRGVYRIPKGFFLSRWVLHTKGAVVGMDASSVATVVALMSSNKPNSETYGPILDICCSPGMKLRMIAELTPLGTVIVGSDNSVRRLAVTKSLIQKNKNAMENLILIKCDGRVLSSEIITDVLKSSVDDSTSMISDDGKPALVLIGDQIAEKVKLLRSNSCETKKIHLNEIVPKTFGRILVDVECTHDGSLNHILNKDNSEDENNFTFQQNMTKYKKNYRLHHEEDENLLNLQYKILENAFQMLEVDGVLVYSTCSRSPRQNQDIILNFLSQNKNAELIYPFNEFDNVDGIRFTSEQLSELQSKTECAAENPFLINITPERANTNFQFISKIVKRHNYQ